MPSPDSHVLTIGPKYLWLMSQLWNLGDEREKHQADNNTKGVVGNIGRKIPMKPRTRLTQPVENNNSLVVEPFESDKIILLLKVCRGCLH